WTQTLSLKGRRRTERLLFLTAALLRAGRHHPAASCPYQPVTLPGAWADLSPGDTCL
ncbi:CPAMD8 isoform 21, partial [Pongo abelii]